MSPQEEERYVDMQDQLERVLDARTPLDRRYLVLHPGDRLQYVPEQEALPDFLVRVYRSIESDSVKGVFRSALGHLFAKYILAPRREIITAESPAVILIRVVPRVRAHKQLYAFMRHFPEAKLSETEVDCIALAMIRITGEELRRHPTIVREALRRLIRHPRIRPERVLDAFLTELSIERGNAIESFEHYARRIEGVCRSFESSTSHLGGIHLKKFFGGLKEITPEGKRFGTHGALYLLFRSYDVPYGHWRALFTHANQK